MDAATLTHILDLSLVKFFVIVFATLICWYLISRISYGGK